MSTRFRLSRLIDVTRVSPCESCRPPVIGSPVWTSRLRFDCLRRYIARTYTHTHTHTRIYIEKDSASIEYFWKLGVTLNPRQEHRDLSLLIQDASRYREFPSDLTVTSSTDRRGVLDYKEAVCMYISRAQIHWWEYLCNARIQQNYSGMNLHKFSS